MGNLEIPLTTSNEKAEKAFTLKADPKLAHDLKQAGFDAVTVANNHALDYGWNGLRETLEALDEAEIASFGGGATSEEAYAPRYFETELGVVALFGIACTLPPGFAAGKNRPGVAPVRVTERYAVDPLVQTEQPGMAPFVHTAVHEPDVATVCAAISAARTRADLIVVMAHWGVPHGWAAPSYGPLATYQRPLGRRLIDAGADLVIGHHPHVLHEIERYAGGLIAYSIGNFVFHDWGDLNSSEFVSDIPMSPFRNPLGDDATSDSVMVLVDRAAKGFRCRFASARLPQDGEAELAPDATTAVAERLGRIPHSSFVHDDSLQMQVLEVRL